MINKLDIINKPITFDKIVDQLIARTNTFPLVKIGEINITYNNETNSYNNVLFKNVKEGKLQILKKNGKLSVIPMEVINFIKF